MASLVLLKSLMSAVGVLLQNCPWWKIQIVCLCLNHSSSILGLKGSSRYPTHSLITPPTSDSIQLGLDFPGLLDSLISYLRTFCHERFKVFVYIKITENLKGKYPIHSLNIPHPLLPYYRKQYTSWLSLVNVNHSVNLVMHQFIFKNLPFVRFFAD